MQHEKLRFYANVVWYCFVVVCVKTKFKQNKLLDKWEFFFSRWMILISCTLQRADRIIALRSLSLIPDAFPASERCFIEYWSDPLEVRNSYKVRSQICLDSFFLSPNELRDPTQLYSWLYRSEISLTIFPVLLFSNQGEEILLEVFWRVWDTHINKSYKRDVPRVGIYWPEYCF